MFPSGDFKYSDYNKIAKYFYSIEYFFTIIFGYNIFIFTNVLADEIFNDFIIIRKTCLIKTKKSILMHFFRPIKSKTFYIKPE